MQADPSAFVLDSRLEADTRPILRSPALPAPPDARRPLAVADPRAAARGLVELFDLDDADRGSFSTRRTRRPRLFRPQRTRRKSTSVPSATWCASSICMSSRARPAIRTGRSRSGLRERPPLWLRRRRGADPFRPGKASADVRRPHSPRVCRQRAAPRRRVAHRRLARGGARPSAGARLSGLQGQWLCRGGDRPIPLPRRGGAGLCSGPRRSRSSSATTRPACRGCVAGIDDFELPEGIALWDCARSACASFCRPPSRVNSRRAPIF